MASPTSWLGTSALPDERIASSTRCASCCSASSSTGRPWHALRTPQTTLSRLNGSVTPDRFTTARTASSTVVNRRPHSEQDRRRRVACPSSTSRGSTTRESEWRQNRRHLQLLTGLNGRVRHAVQLSNPFHHRTLVGLRRYPLRNIPHGLASADPGQRGLSRNPWTGGLAHPTHRAGHS